MPLNKRMNKMNVTLYHAAELAKLENFVDTETGEIDIAGFDSAQITLQEKSRAVVAYIKNEQALIEMMKNAEKDLAAKRKAREAHNENLKDYLYRTMRQTETTEISAADGTFKAKLYLERDESVAIDEGATFPPELCNPPRPPEPSKTLIKEAILRGEPIKGAHIIKKDRLEIK